MSLTIPTAERAEAEAVGTAVADAVGFAIAAEHVTAGDFYRPSFGRLFDACAGLGDVARGWDSSERIGLAARAAGVGEAEVRRLVDQRSRFHDTNGHFARLVADAARRRRAMAAAAEMFNRLGAGASVEEAAALVRSWAA